MGDSKDRDENMRGSWKSTAPSSMISHAEDHRFQRKKHKPSVWFFFDNYLQRQRRL